MQDHALWFDKLTTNGEVIPFGLSWSKAQGGSDILADRLGGPWYIIGLLYFRRAGRQAV